MYEPDSHLQLIPHARALGFRLVSWEGDTCVTAVDYAEHLIGDPDTGVIHGGVVTALLDNACGMVARPSEFDRENLAVATLDLRIDYMQPARPGEAVFAKAHCYRRTSNIAFIRGIAYQDDENKPIANAVAAFMLGTRNAPGGTNPGG